MDNYSSIPSPCYVLEEQLLRKNLELIKSIKEKANIDIILAFKGFSMWGVFPIVREYINGATASSLHEVKLCYEEMKTLSHTYAPVYSESEIHEINSKSRLVKKYSQIMERESAYEILIKKIDAANEKAVEEKETRKEINTPSTATTLGKSALKIVTSASFIRGAFSILSKILKK